MKIGIEIRDENNNIILDTSDLTTIMLGTYTTGTEDGSYTDANIANRDVWVAVVSVNGTFDANHFPCTPVFSVDGNTISWVFDNGGQTWGVVTGCTFLYGVY